jgi:formate hydrogenlyase subunit 6/NADH:ubiquinone oxidoreductase subunit I
MFSLFTRRFAQRGPLRRYPAEPNPPAPAFRGMPELLTERCRGHAACAAACPGSALVVERTASGWVWALDRASCLACGLCADACPERAIATSPAFELAARSREALRVRVAVAASQAEQAR